MSHGAQLYQTKGSFPTGANQKKNPRVIALSNSHPIKLPLMVDSITMKAQGVGMYLLFAWAFMPVEKFGIGAP